MSVGPVLLTGPGGFIGGHVLRALRDAHAGARIRLLRHRRPLDEAAGCEVATGDLTDPASLRHLCDGIATLVHAASFVGDDEERCEAVNARGTEALVRQAVDSGVQRIIGFSSAAVYGYAVHRGATEQEVIVAPATPVSRSRARGERAVLEAGGIVLRPLFVYGDGDTRFLPAIIAGLRTLPFLVDRGRARLSVISADELGAVAARLLAREERLPPGPYHVTDGRPISFRDTAGALAAGLGVRVPRASVPYAAARRLVPLLRRLRSPGRPWTASDAHRLYLVSHDHYYDDAALRSALDLPSGPGLRERLPGYAGWYARYAGTRRTARAELLR